MEKIYRTTVDGAFELTGKELEDYLAYCALAQTEQKAIFAATARAQRNSLLVASDWIELPSCPFSDIKKQEWSAYRQALRDIPQQPGFPTEITWPVPPT